MEINVHFFLTRPYLGFLVYQVQPQHTQKKLKDGEMETKKVTIIHRETLLMTSSYTPKGS